MTFEVFYAPEASDDIDRAFEWFSARAPAVAVDFVRAIGQTEVHLEGKCYGIRMSRNVYTIRASSSQIVRSPNLEIYVTL